MYKIVYFKHMIHAFDDTAARLSFRKNILSIRNSLVIIFKTPILYDYYSIINIHYNCYPYNQNCYELMFYRIEFIFVKPHSKDVG